MKKAEFIKEIIEGYSWSPGEKLEFRSTTTLTYNCFE